MSLKSFQVIAISPFASPLPAVVLAAARAGALGVLDPGPDPAAAAGALAVLATEPEGSLGIRLPKGTALGPTDLPRSFGTVLLEAGVPLEPWATHRVLVQVTSVADALAAVAAGAHGLIAKGAESGGPVGDETAFVLLQSLRRRVSLPVWVQGGITLHTAAAAVAGGAAGVVIDSQLALARESTLPADVKAAVAAMDGSETIVVHGNRIFNRPDLPVRELASGTDIAARLGAAGLHVQLLPAGQDATFAKSLAQRFRTVGGIVRGIDAAIAAQITAARTQRVLAPGSAFAAQFGLRHPILQGPMTRVSDRAGFAAAVAEGGGLPFLALALMRGPEVEALLAETAQRLAGQPWGVGILGFVPPELQEEQLDVVRRIRPPVALIAGGRPAQARPLEALGIATFLHTPSPGLLDLFLKQGARRFVFEGSECGGHVGPRSSFVLWAQQIERLLAHETPRELDLVFAGGIHDARSAAMVAAMVAPLVERGARVGVLMGTAYLFTLEAVASGAIMPGFQASALACANTVLLETAPGHATRCADTEYVQLFRTERARLEAAGIPAQELWQELEMLNLGRARVAAKGVKREGDVLVAVDADAQRRDGMVMLGQVAALHDTLTTVAALHQDVAVASGAVLDSATFDLPPARASRAADVAIVGLAAIMPGATDTETFWANIVGGVNSIREVPAERWRAETFFDPASTNGEMTPSKWGGFLDPVAFDPLVYGIPPLSLAAIEPVQLLALEVSRRALDDAGYLDREFDRENTSVIFGAEAGTDLAGAYGFRAMWRQYAGSLPAELDAVLPRMTEDSFPGILANVIAGRIANRLDLGGVNYTVDAACAASLAAVDMACKELVSGTSDMVICGGADLHNSVVDFLAFASVHALSPTGQCRTFDAAADGISLGEGVAAVVLKRLADAERDGDRIYAVIKGVGGASDGKSLGLTAPRAQGQARTLERAYERAGVSAAAVGMVEAHGTGTVVGDRTELETLNRFFGSAGALPGSIALGSIKSQIGHTKCAAGLAGLIKSALALHRRVLPPTLNIERPNPAWTPASPFTLNSVARPWPGRDRVAGVSAFGFGGTNFHVVLAEYARTPAKTGLPNWPAELFLIRGADREHAHQRVDALERALADDGLALKDLAASVSSEKGPVQIAIVAQDRQDLRRRLALARAGSGDKSGVILAEPDSSDAPPQVAFLFPGQGSQRVGMLGDLFTAFPALQRFLVLGERWTAQVFPATPWAEGEAEAQRLALTDTRVAQPALGMAGLAMAELLGQCGVNAQFLAGHSYGELVALCVAGALPEAALLPLSQRRGERILEACASTSDTGSMAAVAADAAAVKTRLAGLDGVVVANENSPDQVVISGPTAGVAAAVERFLAAGIAAQAIPVACAFHSPLIQGACDAFAADLRAIPVAARSDRVWSNTTAAPYPSEPDQIRAMLAAHIGEPVRFAAQIEAMYAAGARIFVEAGPGTVLSGLVRRILRGRPHVALNCDRTGEPGITQFLRVLGQLAVRGVCVDATALYAGRGIRRIDLDAPPAAARDTNTWWVNGQRAWPMHGELPAHAMHPITAPVVTPRVVASAPGVGDGGGDRQAVVLQYLRSMREMVDTQRNVMLAYLGSAEDSGAIDAAAQARIPDTAPAVPHPAIAADAEPDAGNARGENPDVGALLLAIVCERTGYPADMLGLDLDLEADLSIDSIKRVEILGALAEQLDAGSAGAIEQLPENVLALKTLREIIAALQPIVEGGVVSAPASEASDEMPAVTAVTAVTAVLLSPASTAEAAPASASPRGPAPEFETARLAGPAVSRFVVERRTTTRANGRWELADCSVDIVGASPGLETLLMGGLEAAGSKGVPRAAGSKAVPRDGAAADANEANGSVALVDLTPLNAGWTVDEVPALFDRVRGALVAGARHVLVAGAATANGSDPGTGAGLPQSSGASGMVKSLRKEWPDRHVRIAQFPAGTDDARLARLLLDELNCTDVVGEVCYTDDGVRQLLHVVPAMCNGVGTEASLVLDRESVVLVTGGARGITAKVVRELARRYACRLEIVGRTPPPSMAEAPDLHGAADERAVRRVLIARDPRRRPVEIEAECARVLAEREVRQALAALDEAGASVTYHVTDVRDRAAFGRVIDDVYARHGRLDGVIHAAGVIEDKLARDKTLASFARVFETKVNGALTIAERVRDDVGFVVFFSSIASTFGNRGQADYAAANDVLDRLAHTLGRRVAGRVLSINWGPWGGTGMAAAGLEHEYARRGIGLIEPEAGVASFLDELLHGTGDHSQVILMRGDPSAMQ